jgi:hypothetical protein
MYLSEDLQKKWGPVLSHEDLPPIKDSYRRAVTAVLLENQEKAMREQQSQDGGMFGNIQEAAHANKMGSSEAGTGGIDYVDPVLISLVRRAMPNLIAYDVCGVQPMNGPTGLIFCMKSHYTSQTGAEAGHDEADTSFSGAVTHSANSNPADASMTTGTSVTTAVQEADVTIPEMAFAIDKVTVTAGSRALKAEYTMELAQDLKAVHGLDAETELSNILSGEILAEINREVMRTIYTNSKPGAQHNVATPGTFDLDTDSNGRWSVEKFKGLMFQIEREANAIAKDTRRGKGNILITSSDVASALAMAGQLSGVPTGNDIHGDDTGATMVGTLNGRYKVFVDPYAPTSATNFFTVGYKGSSAYDAGLFYCPYVPLQMVRAVGENSFQPKIGFKTRYGLVSNPFANDTGASGNGVGDGSLTANLNRYYRHVIVANLM